MFLKISKHLPSVFALGLVAAGLVACDDPKATGVKAEPGSATKPAPSLNAKASATAAAASAKAPPKATAAQSSAQPGASSTAAAPNASGATAPTAPSPTEANQPRRRGSRSSFFRKSTSTKAAPDAAGASPSALATAAPLPTSTATPPPPKPAATVKLETPKAGTADAVAAQVDAVYLPIVRFRARFKQRYKAKIAGTTKVSSGVCYVQRPGKISFSYHEPNKNRVVSDGVTLKVYEHENKQMFLRPVANTEYPGALAFIMGKGLRQSYRFSFNKKSKWEGGPVLMGRPRIANPAYKKVFFYIDRELLAKSDPACVRRVLVLDAQRNQNRFDFLHIEQPATVSPTIFSFTAPPGTNIIK